MRRPVWPVSIAIILFIISLGAGTRLGIEFVPRLEEGDLALQVWRGPSLSRSETAGTGPWTWKRFARVFQGRPVLPRTRAPRGAAQWEGGGK